MARGAPVAGGAARPLPWFTGLGLNFGAEVLASRAMSQTTSFPKSKIKVLLLENIHETARSLISADGLDLEVVPGAMGEEELKEKIRDVHMVGLRSKTNITGAVIESAQRLLAIGCFCIGTNQVDLEAAHDRGIPVFNAPFSNTRSVAELVISDIVALARHIPDHVRDMHQGAWNKSASGSFEVRGKTLGIIGYGRIGRQVGVLAEAMGLSVLFYDIEAQLPMGNNRAVGDLSELLALSDQEHDECGAPAGDAARFLSPQSLAWFGGRYPGSRRGTGKRPFGGGRNRRVPQRATGKRSSFRL